MYGRRSRMTAATSDAGLKSSYLSEVIRPQFFHETGVGPVNSKIGEFSSGSEYQILAVRSNLWTQIHLIRVDIGAQINRHGPLPVASPVAYMQIVIDAVDDVAFIRGYKG